MASNPRSNENLETDDDWKTQSLVSCEIDRVIVPSFIRLFVINRIFSNHSNVNRNFINNLTTSINDPNTHQSVQTILTQLLKHGIKKYMKYYFNEKQHTQTIELIFNTIILEKFDKEYQSVITYVRRHSSQENSDLNDLDASFFQTTVFNTCDLMSFIFQYLEYHRDFTGDLFNCSISCTHWLYHVWNPNSIYYTNLNGVVSRTEKLSTGAIVGMWQRMINIKHFDISMSELRSIPNDCILQHLSMLKNIIKLSLRIETKHILLLKVLMQNCREKIEHWDVRVYSDESDIPLSPLTLSNCKHLELYNKYLVIKWSNRCEKLILNELKDIDSKWLQFVMDNCDCSGVKWLHLDDIEFSESLPKILLSEFVNKLINLQYLIMTCYEQSVERHLNLILLLKYLSDILKKNNARVVFSIVSCYADGKKLIDMIVENGIKINELNIWMDVQESIEFLLPVIFTSHLEKLTFDYWISGDDVIKNTLISLLKQATTSTSTAEGTEGTKKAVKPASEKAEMKEEKEHDCQVSLPDSTINTQDETTDNETNDALSSLEMIQFERSQSVNINQVNHFLYLILQLMAKFNNNLFVQTNLAVAVNKNTEKFIELFRTLCQHVFTLMITKKAAIDIKIAFRGDIAQDDLFMQKCRSCFESYFDQTKLLKVYKRPIGNKYCNGLKEPICNLDDIVSSRVHIENAVSIDDSE